MATVTPEQERSQFAARRPRVWLRVLVSGLLVVHLSAVIAPPYRFASGGPRGVAPTAERLMASLKPYIDFAYLDHGYFFFAPNPGASHLMQVSFETDEGEKIERRYPDRKAHWPRLLYHRHFMLAEWLNAGFAPPQAPAEILDDRPQVLAWQRQRTMYESVRRSYENHLQKKYGADRLTLQRIEHRPPDLDEFYERGWKLNDPRLYSVLPEEAEPLDRPFGPPWRPQFEAEEVLPGTNP